MAVAVSLLFQYGVAALLLFSFVGKVLAGRRVNVDHLQRYQLIPGAALFWVSVLLPPVELVLAVGLIVRVEPRVMAVACGALFLVFAAAMASALVRGIVTHCGCYGTLYSAQVSWKLVARNLLIAALLLITAWTTSGHDLAFLHAGTSTAVLVLGLAFVVGVAVGEVIAPRVPRRDPVT